MHRAAVLTDFSAAARAGLRVAFSWLPGLGLAEPEGRLDVLHASWPEEPELRDATAGWMEDLLDKEIAEASSGLSDRPTRVRPHLVWRSPPTEAVAEEVRREDYQLLVVSTRGLGRVRRGLLGSVTLGLLHTAPCPVLAVPRKRRKR